VLVGGAVLALVLIFLNIDGGMLAAVSTAHKAGKFHTFNWTWDYTVASVWVCVVGNAFATAYPSTADQCVVQRYLSTATEAQAARAVWTNALLTIPTSILFFGIGTALWVFYDAHPDRIDRSLPNDAVLPMFVIDRFPAGLAGLLIAGIFAAAMSTLSSSLNSVAAVLGNDFYKRLCTGVTDRQELIFARVVTTLFGAAGTCIAAIMAGMNRPSLFEDWLTILGLVGGGLAGIMALGIFTRRANGFGAVVGAVVSAIVVLWVWTSTPVHVYLYGMIGFLTSFGVGYAASLVGGVRPEGVKPRG
jgi:Na+/proline symporter